MEMKTVIKPRQCHVKGSRPGLEWLHLDTTLWQKTPGLFSFKIFYWIVWWAEYKLFWNFHDDHIKEVSLHLHVEETTHYNSIVFLLSTDHGFWELAKSIAAFNK